MMMMMMIMMMIILSWSELSTIQKAVEERGVSMPKAISDAQAELQEYEAAINKVMVMMVMIIMVT
jgi:hypothetical protein